MATSFLYLTLGLILANIGHLASRNRESHNSPVKFNLWFWVTDNWVKVLTSFSIATVLNVICNWDPVQTTHVVGFEWKTIFSVGIGLFPDAILAFLKNKFNWMQPQKAVDSDGKVYNRKDSIK